MSKIFGAFRKLSNLAIKEPNFYSENIIVYNKRQKYFEEFRKTYYVNNNNVPVCVLSTGNVCTICKGEGIVFNNKSIIDFNYYKLCDNCNGKGYLL
tara:strand:- start:2630 stop:2917 length:288 start_codon:yes stop_codon:yes gene_type:complete